MLNQEPPKLTNRILRWFCREDLLEDIEGDIAEIFIKQTREKGFRKASILYFWNVLRFFRWSNVINSNKIQFSNNTIDMIKNILR